MKNKGFSLIELMIVVAIIGILAYIAIPSYQNYVKKSRRYEAISSLSGIQMAQEKYRTNNSTYGTLATVWNGVTQTPGGYYNLTVTNVTGSSYTLTATGTGTQTSDNERGTACSTLTLTVNGTTTTRAPSICWGN